MEDAQGAATQETKQTTLMAHFVSTKARKRGNSGGSAGTCKAQRKLVLECYETLDAQSCSAAREAAARAEQHEAAARAEQQEAAARAEQQEAAARAEQHKANRVAIGIAAALAALAEQHDANCDHRIAIREQLVMWASTPCEITPPLGNVSINALLVDYLGGSGSFELFEQGCNVIMQVYTAQYMWQSSQRAVTHSMLLFFYYLHKQNESTEKPPDPRAAALACCQLACKLQVGYNWKSQDFAVWCNSKVPTEHTSEEEIYQAQIYIQQGLRFDIHVSQALEQFHLVIDTIESGSGLPPLNAKEIAELLVRGTYEGNIWTAIDLVIWTPTTT
jgi:nucleoid-associated protein YgaU